MIYWKGEKFWLGKLLERPEIMTQGETLEELEENIKDAYLLIEGAPEHFEMNEIALQKKLYQSEFLSGLVESLNGVMSGRINEVNCFEDFVRLNAD
jgi:predicted RNase H-like HicB family nuclease